MQSSGTTLRISSSESDKLSWRTTAAFESIARVERGRFITSFDTPVPIIYTCASFAMVTASGDRRDNNELMSSPMPADDESTVDGCWRLRASL